MNTQSEKPKFHGTKTDPKKISKIPMPPLWMNRSVQSRTHTNDNTTTIIITETSTKTLFYRYYFPIRNMLQNNSSHAIFFREGVMSRNRIIRRLRTSMLDTTAAASRIFLLFFFCNYRSIFYG